MLFKELLSNVMWIEEREIGFQIGGLGMNAMAMSVMSLSFDGEGGWWLIFSFRFLGFGGWHWIMVGVLLGIWFPNCLCFFVPVSSFSPFT